MYLHRYLKFFMKIKQYQSYFNPGLQGPVGPGGSPEGFSPRGIESGIW